MPKGLAILKARQHRQEDRRDRRRDDAAARSRALSVRPQPARHRRSLAPRQRDRFLAARSVGGGAGRRTPRCRSSPAGCPIPARAAGRSRPRSTKACRRHVLSAGALRAVQLARRGGIRRQAALGDALRVRRASSKSRPKPDAGSVTRTVSGSDDMAEHDLDQLAINTIRTLSIDAVQQAKSGHPGTPMALAPLVYTIWNRVMRFDPKDPIWPNRDRFVLSNGHASMLLWSVLHLTGTQAVNADYERLGTAVGDARRHPPLPPARQQGAGPSGISLGLGRRDHHRPAGPGHRHQRRHGDRPQMAGQPLQPAGLRYLRLQHLRGLRRRLPDGRRRLGGGVAGRASRPRQPVLDLRQQPHHHRRQHAASPSPKMSRPASWL